MEEFGFVAVNDPLKQYTSAVKLVYARRSKFRRGESVQLERGPPIVQPGASLVALARPLFQNRELLDALSLVLSHEAFDSVCKWHDQLGFVIFSQTQFVAQVLEIEFSMPVYAHSCLPRTLWETFTAYLAKYGIVDVTVAATDAAPGHFYFQHIRLDFVEGKDIRFVTKIKPSKIAKFVPLPFPAISSAIEEHPSRKRSRSLSPEPQAEVKRARTKIKSATPPLPNGEPPNGEPSSGELGGVVAPETAPTPDIVELENEVIANFTPETLERKLALVRLIEETTHSYNSLMEERMKLDTKLSAMDTQLLNLVEKRNALSSEFNRL
ncbi:uncharacterized protein AMSG_10029 [Thecamonas trahens ATCC 50062]|uniref:Uncharacterized protein n=1 Tax=Thecamonas trahens ATCC 50062 TaxID=461836 RepID=A0A0L0DPQ6_THETB|nr:hypothetical protein AMSG_10029 [Thecamonas trahens ATCC 50062]KNC54235.1 hypothetical protein AMSG_10029 [Thecamonas trahens ATCC 50062]|eukprot:XP_013753873.1 hypothetical protein AMSG_10029 [Thecamonas trahens ATCC 50062]